MSEIEPYTPIDSTELKAGMIIKQGTFTNTLYKIIKVKRVNMDYISFPSTPFDDVKTVRIDSVSNITYVKMDVI